jgi:hypothetical protein
MQNAVKEVIRTAKEMFSDCTDESRSDAREVLRLGMRLYPEHSSKFVKVLKKMNTVDKFSETEWENYYEVDAFYRLRLSLYKIDDYFVINYQGQQIAKFDDFEDAKNFYKAKFIKIDGSAPAVWRVDKAVDKPVAYRG